MVLAAAILWSTSGFFAKAPFWNSWEPGERGVALGFWRALCAALTLLPFVRQRSWSWALIPAGLSFALMNGAFLHAITLTTEANALWLQYTCPLWCYLIGVRFFAARVDPRDLGMLIGVGTGVLTILVSEWLSVQSNADSFRGSVWGLIAGLALAGVMLSLKYMPPADPVWVIAVCHLTAALALLPFVWRMGSWPESRQLPWLLAFGGLQMALPYVLFYRGVRRLPAHEASSLALLEPMLVSLWVYLAWGGRADYVPPRITTWIGGGLILAGLLWRYGPPISWGRRSR